MFCTIFNFQTRSSALSVMSKSSGHESLISAAFFKTLATVFLDTPQLCAMFLSLNPKLFKRRISRYLVITYDLPILSSPNLLILLALTCFIYL